MELLTKITTRLLLLSVVILLNACTSIIQSSYGTSLPVLAEEELNHSYIKLGRIQITREVYGTDAEITANITDWGVSAVRQEAEKMGADAVMNIEVTGHTTSYNLFPSTEYRATGFAIKFK